MPSFRSVVGHGLSETATRVFAMIFAIGLAMPAVMFMGTALGHLPISVAHKEADGVWTCGITQGPQPGRCVTPIDLAITTFFGTTSIAALIGLAQHRRAPVFLAATLLLLAGAFAWLRTTTARTAAHAVGDFSLGLMFLIGTTLFLLALPAPRSRRSTTVPRPPPR